MVWALRTVAILLLASSAVYGLEVDRNFSRIELKDACDAIVVDSNIVVDSAAASRLLESPDWNSCSNVSLARGYTDDTLWLKLQLKNTDTRKVSLSLDLYTAWLRDIRVYRFNNGELITEREYGIKFPFGDRDIPTPNIMLGMTLEPGVERTYLLHISSVESMLIGGYIHSANSSYQQQIMVNMINGGVIFSIAILTLYNLFLFFSLRDLNYIYYVLYSASMLFILGVIYGFNYQVFWPNSPEWNSFTYSAASPFTAIFIVMFVRRFINTPEVSKSIDRVLQLFLYGSVIILCLSVLEVTRDWAMFWSGPLASIGGPAIFLAGIVAWKNGQRSARYFTIAWTASVLSMTVLGLMVMGYLEFNFWLYYSFAIGVLLEIVLLSLALADKYHDFRREKMESELTALAAERDLAQGLKKAAQELEHKVRVRTADLRTAKKEAEVLARTDDLTGMANRRSFFERGEQEFLEAMKGEASYGIVMLDIDKFKQVNDQYGHASGDVVIIKVAEIMMTLVPDDAIVGRIGGEEFGVILPAYTLDTVADVAEAMRESIEAKIMRLPEGETIRITASLGVSEYQSDDVSLDEAMARADLGLYRAKETGRNKVCIHSEA
jgi:diguanylate cyclase